MKVVKKTLAATTLVLLVAASYMRLTERVVTSKFVTRRGGPWVTGYDSGNSIFLCALFTGGVWLVVFWMDRQRS